MKPHVTKKYQAKEPKHHGDTEQDKEMEGLDEKDAFWSKFITKTSVYF